ncbi:MAG: sigma-54 dependent transcriptional regulator [Bacteroidales bacterium]|jgi:two-component system response regulator HydG|nr:sigma-54 dependent transcriptional regulator [Bacteroidales bacterium]
MKKTILIIEDDTSFGTMLQLWCKKNNFEAQVATTLERAKLLIVSQAFHVVLSDMRLPDGDGIMFLSWLNEKKITIPVIIMTSYAEVQSAVLAIKLGAFDYFEKPINPSILKQKVEQALAASESENTAKQSVVTHKKSPNSMTLGVSKQALQVTEHIQLVAPTNLSVLILGESGTGKEYVARMIHEQSSRKSAPFFAVDCGSLSKELAPSELFGHLKGSFTSAISDKKGVFEQACGGTVFLDEVGNLSYDVQIQLLRVLQEQKVRPVGAVTDVAIDIRILAATNENLEHAIAEGKFREDLYHRLHEFSINIAPLRERIADIPFFARIFLAEANKELNKDIHDFSPAVIEKLQAHYWSGNLRELRNVVRRAALFCQSAQIETEHLPLLQAPPVKQEEKNIVSAASEKEQIEAALTQAGGKKSRAAQILKIDRKTLYNKLHQHGMI